MERGLVVRTLPVVQEDVSDQRLPDPDPFHGLQVASDALFGDVVADPLPIAPGLGGIGRVEEPLFRGGGREQARRQQE